jgi:hypothetical protein
LESAEWWIIHCVGISMAGFFLIEGYLTLEAPVVLHNVKAPKVVKLTAVCFINF